jgi:hypothetical protein
MKQKTMSNAPFIVEAHTQEEANNINTELYRFERFSESKGVYIFVKRSR